MRQVTSHSSIDHLELNHSALAGKLPSYLHAKQGNWCGESKQGLMRFYVSDDVENDVRRCISSWEHQHPISVNGRTVTGKIKCFSGTVEAVARAPELATGDLWLVSMRELTLTSDLFDANNLSCSI